MIITPNALGYRYIGPYSYDIRTPPQQYVCDIILITSLVITSLQIPTSQLTRHDIFKFHHHSSGNFYFDHYINLLLHICSNHLNHICLITSSYSMHIGYLHGIPKDPSSVAPLIVYHRDIYGIFMEYHEHSVLEGVHSVLVASLQSTVYGQIQWFYRVSQSYMMPTPEGYPLEVDHLEIIKGEKARQTMLWISCTYDTVLSLYSRVPSLQGRYFKEPLFWTRTMWY